MITLEKINNSFLKIHAEEGILMEIHELYSFYVPGYKFMPKYKNKMWDGRARLFSLRTRLLPIGLIRNFLDHCEAQSYEVLLCPQLISSILSAPQKALADSSVRSFTRAVRLPENRQFRDYQLDAIVDAVVEKRKIIVSATGSGKSLIIYGIILSLLEQNPDAKILLLVPTINLTNQMLGDFVSYSTENGLDFTTLAQILHGGQSKQVGPDTRVLISTWQSAQTMEADWFSQWTGLICDEVHLFKSDVVKTIVERCDCEYKIGTTGTLSDAVTDAMQLRGLFGDDQQYTTSVDLMRDGKIAQLKIKGLVLVHDPQSLPKISSYREEVDFLKKSDRKINFLAKLALATEGNTLVMFSHVDSHARVFFEKINSLNKIGKKIFLFIGATPPHEREKIRNLVDGMNNAIIIGSSGVIATGTNIVNLSNLIYAASTKGKILNLQSIGRVLRKSETKTSALLFDVTDDLTGGKKKKNYTLEHFHIRHDRYLCEGFDVSVQKIKL